MPPHDAGSTLSHAPMRPGFEESEHDTTKPPLAGDSITELVLDDDLLLEEAV